MAIIIYSSPGPHTVCACCFIPSSLAALTSEVSSLPKINVNANCSKSQINSSYNVYYKGANTFRRTIHKTIVTYYNHAIIYKNAIIVQAANLYLRRTMASEILAIA